MNRSLVALGLLAAGAFLIPHDAFAQRDGAGFRGGAPSFRSGGGGSRIGMAGPRGFAGPALAGRPSFRGGAVDIRRGGFRPGFSRPFYRGYYGRGWGYPYYGGALLTGLTIGALSYPYYGGPYLYAGAPYAGECYWERRRVIDPWGRVVRRLVQVCEY